MMATTTLISPSQRPVLVRTKSPAPAAANANDGAFMGAWCGISERLDRLLTRHFAEEDEATPFLHALGQLLDALDGFLERRRTYRAREDASNDFGAIDSTDELDFVVAAELKELDRRLDLSAPARFAMEAAIGAAAHRRRRALAHGGRAAEEHLSPPYRDVLSHLTSLIDQHSGASHPGQGNQSHSTE